MIKNPQDDPATEEFVRELTNHQTVMLAFIRSRVPGSSGARDLLQDVNITLWQRRDSFELGTNFKAWAFQTIRYHILNQRRKLASQGWLVFDDDLLERMSPDTEADTDGLEERHLALRKCLSRLRPKDRELLFHRYATDAPLQEFADRTKRSTGTLKAILYNLRASLRQCIERQLKSSTHNTP